MNWKSLKTKPCKACSSQYHDHPMRTHFYQGQNPWHRLPALCRKAGANNLPCVHVAQRTEWCWRSSPQRPLWNNSGCLVAVCMRSVSNSWHSSQMFKPPLHPPPHSSPLTERAGGRKEIEACFARAFLNILLCSLFATPSFKSQSRRLF